MAAERFAGGRGTAFDTQTAVKAKPGATSLLLALPVKMNIAIVPAYPEAIRNIEMYRPAVVIVVTPIM